MSNVKNEDDSINARDFTHGFGWALFFSALAFFFLGQAHIDSIHMKDRELANQEDHYEQLLEATRNAKSPPTPPANTTFWKYTDESGQVFYTNKKTGDQAAEQVLILHPAKN
ncbi:DUF4124 domain-containing protein [Duganella sp. PWIR1]